MCATVFSAGMCLPGFFQDVCLEFTKSTLRLAEGPLVQELFVDPTTVKVRNVERHSTAKPTAKDKKLQGASVVTPQADATSKGSELQILKTFAARDLLVCKALLLCKNVAHPYPNLLPAHICKVELISVRRGFQQFSVDSTAKWPPLPSEGDQEMLLIHFEVNKNLNFLPSHSKRLLDWENEGVEWVAPAQMIGPFDFTDLDCRVFSRAGVDDVIVNDHNIMLTPRHLSCLLPGAWLNDEVINFFLEDLCKPCDSNKTLYFKTHFYDLLVVHGGGYCFDKVARWTEKSRLFEFKIIIIIVHVSKVHWITACVNLEQKSIGIYDSFGKEHVGILGNLQAWLNDAHKQKT